MLTVTANVTNTGTRACQEVVQVYVSCPDGRLKKEYQRLAGFAKTALLAPGESQTLTVEVPVETLASFDAVSYTHLDVYKRQPGYRSFRSIGLICRHSQRRGKMHSA